jgi:hypothetical protein
MIQGQTFDGRSAAILLVGGALNGVVYRVVEAAKDRGAEAPFDFFGVSPFELLIVAVAVHLLWNSGALASSRWAAVGVVACVALMGWPSSLISWPLTGAMAGIVAIQARGRSRTGAILFAALAAWEVWNATLEPLATSSLVDSDAIFVAGLLSIVRDGVVRAGNIVGAAGGHRIVILDGCSTAHFAPLAILGASALLLGRGARVSVSFVSAVAALAVTLVAMNLVRLSLMAWSADLYPFVHGPTGAVAFDTLATLLVLATSFGLPVPARKWS